MSELTKEQRISAGRLIADAVGENKFINYANLVSRLAEVLQYGPNEPSAPLSDEKRETFGNLFGGTLCRKYIDKVIAKRSVRKEETVPIDGTLITRMMDANFAASHTPYSYPPNMVEGMTAAARVIADALLSPLTTDEKQRFGSNYGNCIAYGDVDALLESRRSLIEDEPKTPDERVCIVPNGSGWAVTLDGKNVYWFGNGTNCKDAAEIYRLGLIEQLKQKEAK